MEHIRRKKKFSLYHRTWEVDTAASRVDSFICTVNKLENQSEIIVV